jgi:hypothetical protein
MGSIDVVAHHGHQQQRNARRQEGGEREDQRVEKRRGRAGYSGRVGDCITETCFIACIAVIRPFSSAASVVW